MGRESGFVNVELFPSRQCQQKKNKMAIDRGRGTCIRSCDSKAQGIEDGVLDLFVAPTNPVDFMAVV